MRGILYDCGKTRTSDAVKYWQRIMHTEEKTLFKPAFLILEDGSVFEGQSIGAHAHTCGEVVFNTAMTGYQEIFSDPSYARQMVTLTYPHVGNTGINSLDQESETTWIRGLILRDTPKQPSNWRSTMALEDYLKQQGIVAISGIDTRRLTRLLRDKGSLRGCLSADDLARPVALKMAQQEASLKGTDLAKEVSTTQPYPWHQKSWQLLNDTYPLQETTQRHIVAYDFGIKHNILRLLADRGCRITVVPAKTPAQTILHYQPDGVFLSNGPGDPAPCAYAIEAIEQLLAHNIPMFGICLGYQLLALACGAKTEKMKFGHHGANHPVQDLRSHKVMITSQNHGFAVSEAHLPDCLEATHRSLFDGSLQGLRHKTRPAFGFQGHPEASPGPHDITVLFDQFMELMPI